MHYQRGAFIILNLMPAVFHRALFVVVVGLFFATECFCQAVKIQIDSSWGGLGEPSSSHLLITGNSGKYKADGHAIDSNKIEALLRALDEPSVEQPSLAKCGIDQAWLESNYAMALESISHRKLSELSEKQIDLFKRRFTNSEAAQDAFAGLYKGWHTDDYPQMALKITRGETGLNIIFRFAISAPVALGRFRSCQRRIQLPN
ncbi:MAG: hypothetical protein NVS9B14_17500 [Candidatus Acidiferrum sp.]